VRFRVKGISAWCHFGHEVRLIGDDGVERRIDDTYVPRVEKPAWVGAGAGAAKGLLA
jgi:hypothetical protein